MVETGPERARWELGEIVWAEQAGEAGRMLSDHAAVCFVRPSLPQQGREPRPVLPNMKSWGPAQRKQFLDSEDLEQRTKIGSDNTAEQMRRMDAELRVPLTVGSRGWNEPQAGCAATTTTSASKESEWRLRSLLCIRGATHRVKLLGWITSWCSWHDWHYYSQWRQWLDVA